MAFAKTTPKAVIEITHIRGGKKQPIWQENWLGTLVFRVTGKWKQNRLLGKWVTTRRSEAHGSGNY